MGVDRFTVCGLKISETLKYVKYNTCYYTIQRKTQLGKGVKENVLITVYIVQNSFRKFNIYISDCSHLIYIVTHFFSSLNIIVKWVHILKFIVPVVTKHA